MVMNDVENRISLIFQKFNENFPFLKLEFINEGKKKTFLSKKIKLSSVQPSSNIDMDGSRTVAELEQDFENLFQIPIQVFRKAGSTWVETSLTHDWTLEQQNREGELFSSSAR